MVIIEAAKFVAHNASLLNDGKKLILDEGIRITPAKLNYYRHRMQDGEEAVSDESLNQISDGASEMLSGSQEVAHGIVGRLSGDMPSSVGSEMISNGVSQVVDGGGEVSEGIWSAVVEFLTEIF